MSEAPQVTEASKVVEVKPDRLPEKYAILAAKQRQEREAQRKIEEEKKAWEAERSKYISLDDLQKNPLKYMQQANVTYDQLTQQAITEVDPIQAKLNKINETLSNFENRFQTQSKQQEILEKEEKEAASKQIRFEVEKLVEAPEYEVVKFFGKDAMDRVEEVIFDHYNKTQQLLGVEDAVKKVDSEYTEELKRFTSLNRLKSMFETATTKTDEAIKPKDPAPTTTTTQARTLTNSMTPGTIARRTEKERRERALRAFKGEAID